MADDGTWTCDKAGINKANLSKQISTDNYTEVYKANRRSVIVITYKLVQNVSVDIRIDSANIGLGIPKSHVRGNLKDTFRLQPSEVLSMRATGALEIDINVIEET